MKLGILVIFLFWSAFTFAQNQRTDSLQYELGRAKNDTLKVLILARLGIEYRTIKPDLALSFGLQALSLAKKINFMPGQAFALRSIGFTYRELGDLPKAMQLLLEGLKLAERTKKKREIPHFLANIGAVYMDLGDYNKALAYFRAALTKFEQDSYPADVAFAWMIIGEAHRGLNQLDSAFFYLQRAYKASTRLKRTDLLHVVTRDLGIIEFMSGRPREALFYYQQSIQVALNEHNHRSASSTYYRLAQAYQKLDKRDSCLYYARKGVEEASFGPFPLMMLPSSQLLAELYETENPRESIRYYKLAKAASDSLYGPPHFRQLQRLTLNEQQRQQQLIDAQKEYQNNVRYYAVLTGLGMMLLLAFSLYRNYSQQKKANTLLHRQKDEIAHQRLKAEIALKDLKTTQTQLIQREKMASLGELTAGIAHEIQNPLNFVNNFSEVSVELLEEQKQALSNGDLDQVGVLADDLVQNLQRITQNGQRASNIVKGMLEHSRSSTGERQPTDLNALCEEYLRLAYQGIRAKSPTFTCQLNTHLTPGLPLVEVITQDMSRVLLNLFNNAFYAVGQKQKTAFTDYQPTVWVETTQTNGSVEIRVRDNGVGIPDAIKEKIFQPFFTTKPTGEGTGLGLSLSYDIVTKGHGGTLRVESEEGQGTQFFISLPFDSLAEL